MGVELTTNERIADWFRQRGLGGLAAEVLEALGPLTLLGAQAVYMLDPLVGPSHGVIGDLAQILEDPDRISELIRRLRDEEGGS